MKQRIDNKKSGASCVCVCVPEVVQRWAQHQTAALDSSTLAVRDLGTLFFIILMLMIITFIRFLLMLSQQQQCVYGRQQVMGASSAGSQHRTADCSFTTTTTK